MNRKALVLLFCVLLLAGCGASVQAQSYGSAQSLGNTNIVVVGATSTSQAAPGATTTTITTPDATATTPPAQSTQPATTGNHKCDSSSCENPWGYVIGLKGTEQGEYIYMAPTGFCGWFSCIANFDNGRGYIVECLDGMMSKSGGITGSCSHHQGEWEALYVLTSGGGGPTPTSQPTSQPTPGRTPTPPPVFTPVPATPVPTA